MPIPRSAPAVRLPPGARRAALLQALGTTGGPTTVAALAELSGLHPNTVRAHLDVLVREGRATRRTEERVSRGRPRELYEATGAPDPAAAYAALALLLAEQLAQAAADPAAEGERMGRRWAAADDAAQDVAAARAAPTEPAEATGATGSDAGPADRGASVDSGVDRVVAVLRRAGFAPELSGNRVLLHSCPVRQVAHAQPAVVCQAHLGLIRATLEAAESSVAATRIEPFVEPDLCVAVLEEPASPSSAPA
ncbi:MAG: helix-turn-helix domain-containing protein [Actinotalea sp.]|nr:helix-turn-helix domain-containing protein [Actinotalea sp.]